MSSLLMFSVTAFAQDTPKFEIFGDYSYMQFNPTVTGLQSRALNGGGGGVQANFGRFLGIKGEFQGYGSTQWTTTVSSPIGTPNGIIPVGTYKSNANMFTYLFGPTVGVHTKKLNVYGEVLFGGSNTNGYADLSNAVMVGGPVKAAGTQHPFTMAVGGGVDFNVSRNLAFRLGEFDWILTRYTNPITDTNNQHSFRYLAGVVFKFGGQQ
jgi:opacity protein-like surface antigen